MNTKLDTYALRVLFQVSADGNHHLKRGKHRLKKKKQTKNPTHQIPDTCIFKNLSNFLPSGIKQMPSKARYPAENEMTVRVTFKETKWLDKAQTLSTKLFLWMALLQSEVRKVRRGWRCQFWKGGKAKK